MGSSVLKAILCSLIPIIACLHMAQASQAPLTAAVWQRSFEAAAGSRPEDVGWVVVCPDANPCTVATASSGVPATAILVDNQGNSLSFMAWAGGSTGRDGMVCMPERYACI